MSWEYVTRAPLGRQARTRGVAVALTRAGKYRQSLLVVYLGRDAITWFGLAGEGSHHVAVAWGQFGDEGLLLLRRTDNPAEGWKVSGQAKGTRFVRIPARGNGWSLTAGSRPLVECTWALVDGGIQVVLPTWARRPASKEKAA